MSSVFGEVRGLLQAGASAEAWWSLVSLLDSAAPVELYEVLLPYAQGMLRRWPEDWRVIRSDWVRRTLAVPEHPHPGVLLGKKLSFTHDIMDEECLIEIARGEAFAGISMVQLPSYDVHDLFHEGAPVREAWTQQDAWPALAWLKLMYGEEAEPFCGMLAAAPWFAWLEHLELNHLYVSDEDVEALLLGGPRQLRNLDLGYNSELGDRGAALLATSPHLQQLVYLNLDSCAVGDHGALALGGSEHLAGLTHLLLPRNPNITGAGLRQLLASHHLGRLEALDLCSCDVDSNVATHLSRQEHFAALRHLDLEFNRIGWTGARDLLRAEHFPALERILLAGNHIPDARWPELRQLRLGAIAWDQEIPLQIPPPESTARFLLGIEERAPELEEEDGGEA